MYRVMIYNDGEKDPSHIFETHEKIEPVIHEGQWFDISRVPVPEDEILSHIHFTHVLEVDIARG